MRVPTRPRVVQPTRSVEDRRLHLRQLWAGRYSGVNSERQGGHAHFGEVFACLLANLTHVG